MMPLDTGKCAQESLASLLIQQKQLIEGRRDAQMFPIGTKELEVPEGFYRHANFRGVFHYNPKRLTWQQIDWFSSSGSENQILNLGPFNKFDIAQRAMDGEKVTCITEYTFDGIEVRCAAATNKTLEEQLEFFYKTQEPNSLILVGYFPDRVKGKLNGT